MHPAKATIVEDLQAKLNSSPFLFVADYTGLKVGQFAELRNRLWTAGARCHVVKNTFLRRAAKEAGLARNHRPEGPDGDHHRRQGCRRRRESSEDLHRRIQEAGSQERRRGSARGHHGADQDDRRSAFPRSAARHPPRRAQRSRQQAGPRAQRTRFRARPCAQGQGRTGTACPPRKFPPRKRRRHPPNPPKKPRRLPHNLTAGLRPRRSRSLFESDANRRRSEGGIPNPFNPGFGWRRNSGVEFGARDQTNQHQWFLVGSVASDLKSPEASGGDDTATRKEKAELKEEANAALTASASVSPEALISLRNMADTNTLVDTLSGLTVLEVADLVKKLEEKWGVSAAAPVAAAAGRWRRRRRRSGRGKDRLRRHPQGNRREQDRRHQGSPRLRRRPRPRRSQGARGRRSERPSRRASPRQKPKRSRKRSKRLAPRSRSSNSAPKHSRAFRQAKYLLAERRFVFDIARSQSARFPPRGFRLDQKIRNPNESGGFYVRPPFSGDCASAPRPRGPISRITLSHAAARERTRRRQVQIPRIYV